MLQLALPTEGAPSRQALERRAELLGRLGWPHWQAAAARKLAAAFPPAYPPL